MYVRLTQITFKSEHKDVLRKTYYDEIAPVVRAQKGNIGAWLLESHENDGECISLTEWTTQKDAENYQATGVYTELVNKLKHMYTAKPVLKSYTVEDSTVPSAVI
jgi:quinol monooxygenase YgiN